MGEGDLPAREERVGRRVVAAVPVLVPENKTFDHCRCDGGCEKGCQGDDSKNAVEDRVFCHKSLQESRYRISDDEIINTCRFIPEKGSICGRCG
ncbi:hypothetical protein ASZ90_015351 [hydrocarbon metagenome]|uniref:Uncharacterized protein n=1 Tax=hydrocarbon metagenome TaxID=938273 RepID=A0A0W8F250_9ZZZZ